MSMTFIHCNDYVCGYPCENQTECSELEIKLHLVAFETKSSKSISRGYVLN